MSDAQPMKEPPSSILKQCHQNLKGKDPSEEELEEMAKKVLLPVCEVKLWLDHLDTVDTNRKRGAAKAASAETRRRKLRSQSDQQPAESLTSASYYCGICGALFGDSEECEYWIGCE